MTARTFRWALIALAVGGVCWLVTAAVRQRTQPQTELTQALAGVDRIRVRSGGTCHRDLASERTLFEEQDPARIAAVVRALRIDPTAGDHRCGCCGHPTLEFYRGGELVVILSYHHGRSVRWFEHWAWDRALTSTSARWLNQWLKDHGVESEHGEW